jgi:hypothetical protein
MRNIYNLITDGFGAMGLNESEYTKTIQGNYVIEIIKTRSPLLKATLYVDLTPNNEIYDVTYTNNLFEPHLWDRFCRVFTDEML